MRHFKSLERLDIAMLFTRLIKNKEDRKQQQKMLIWNFYVNNGLPGKIFFSDYETHYMNTIIKCMVSMKTVLI